MRLKYSCFLILLSYASAIRVCRTYLDYANLNSNYCWENEDDKDMPELASQYGYTVVTHTIITADNYILTVFNLKHQHPKGVVLLNHFLFGSSVCWVDKGNASLGYALYNAGYDVWMGNFRGTYYSLEHVQLNNKHMPYWDFRITMLVRDQHPIRIYIGVLNHNSDILDYVIAHMTMPSDVRATNLKYLFHEMGIYDMPAIIKLIKSLTGVRKISYVGFSMGGTVAAVYCTEFPEECAENINVFVLMAPGIAYIKNKALLIQALGQVVDVAYRLMRISKIGQLFARNNDTMDFLNVCRIHPGVETCMTLINQLVIGPCTPNPPLHPVIWWGFPAGQATKTLAHFAQNLKRKSFVKYDYGPALNLRHYRSNTPPNYLLNKIKTKTFIICGNNDFLVPPENCLYAWNQFQPASKATENVHFISDYNHMGFVWAADTDTKINAPIIEMIDLAHEKNW